MTTVQLVGAWGQSARSLLLLECLGRLSLEPALSTRRLDAQAADPIRLGERRSRAAAPRPVGRPSYASNVAQSPRGNAPTGSQFGQSDEPALTRRRASWDLGGEQVDARPEHGRGSRQMQLGVVAEQSYANPAGSSGDVP